MNEPALKVGYVIGPFTSPTAWGLAENIRHAERTGYIIALHGGMPFMPHANTAHFHGLFTPGFWYRGTMEMLKRCDFAVTVEIVGVPTEVLLKSRGARDEMEWLIHEQAERPLFRDVVGLKAYLQGAIKL